jgi:hypothetical protein
MSSGIEAILFTAIPEVKPEKRLEKAARIKI